MAEAAFVTVDVFTEERFAGNPLAVFTDARGIDDDAMQKIAAEFGYSEITFVLPPDNPAHDARVRIFTPTTEVGFAGHPNVGTAFVLSQQALLFGKPVGDILRFEEAAGIVEVQIIRHGGRVTGAAIRAPQPLSVGREIPLPLVAACASLPEAAIRMGRHPPLLLSVGLSFAFAEVADLAALAAARPDTAAFRDAAARMTPDGDFPLFLYVVDPQDPAKLRARMFAPLDNVPEDPATGSASGALAAYLASRDPLVDGRLDYIIEQGIEMGRPSRIEVSVGKRGGAVDGVTIAGRCVAVMRGTISL
ncbi:PhzF family phenazine biosynthesis protein [Rhizobium sp. 0TCS1.26]|uniref:PhzF family phenazine biosynthesis protein n=1 Tax=Rhizobium sp. 0TCS1.26 TaxID=3142623 RepID=UPI003D2BF40D